MKGGWCPKVAAIMRRDRRWTAAVRSGGGESAVGADEGEEERGVGDEWREAVEEEMSVASSFSLS